MTKGGVHPPPEGPSMVEPREAWWPRLETKGPSYRGSSKGFGCQLNNGAAKWDLKNIVEGIDWCEMKTDEELEKRDYWDIKNAMSGTVTRSFCVDFLTVDLRMLLFLSEWINTKITVHEYLR